MNEATPKEMPAFATVMIAHVSSTNDEAQIYSLIAVLHSLRVSPPRCQCGFQCALATAALAVPCKERLSRLFHTMPTKKKVKKGKKKGKKKVVADVFPIPVG